jgi:hypothetical protein
MDKVWLYIGGIIIGAATVGYFVITTVGSSVPGYK